MTLSVVSEVRNVRLAEAIAERRLTIGTWLADLGALIASHNLHVDGAGDIDPRFVIVATLADDGPMVTWTGEPVTTDDLDDLARAFHHIAARTRAGERDSSAIVASAREEWRRTRRLRLAEASRRLRLAEATRRAEASATHPWECEFCRARFKTKRGAEQYERKCKRNSLTRTRANR